MKLYVQVFILLVMNLPLTSCDPEHRKECEWYLVPDLDRKSTVHEGFIPVCARNFVVNKQDCRLETTLEYAQKVYNRKFRYVDLEWEGVGIPRKVKNIKFCDE